MQIKNKFNIGDIVLTKSNGVWKVKAINIFVKENMQCIQYKLDGFEKMFFYEEDLKLIKGRNDMRLRGFEIVREDMRKHQGEIQLPVRGDSRSAGYDLRTPVEVTLAPGERKLVFTDVKAYMQEDEVLELYVRSSIGVKKGIVLSNGTGIIDSSYYSNPDNDGNLGLALWNTTDRAVTLEAQERICQGVFKKYLTVDNDECLHNERLGGFGSSGTK